MSKIYVAYALIAVIFAILTIAHKRHSALNSKLQDLRDAIDKLSSENFKLQQAIKTLQKGAKNTSQIPIEEFKKMELELLELQRCASNDRAYLEENIARLDSKMRSFGSINMHTDINEDKIIKMRMQGMNIDTIADELKISRDEVIFILQLAKRDNELY